jgi:hypothetical protein
MDRRLTADLIAAHAVVTRASGRYRRLTRTLQVSQKFADSSITWMPEPHANHYNSFMSSLLPASVVWDSAIPARPLTISGGHHAYLAEFDNILTVGTRQMLSRVHIIVSPDGLKNPRLQRFVPGAQARQT